MLTRVTKVLVGTDITRTASLVSIYEASPQPAAGEVVVLNKYKDILAAGSTIADSDVIYIAQGTALTYNYANDAGTTVTAARVMKFSDAIEGANILGYRGVAYAAKSEQVSTFAAITSPLTAGTEYVLKLIFKDVKEHRGQFTKTYRFIATGTTSQAVFNGLRAAIAADKGARVAGSGTTTLILTGLPIPESTSTTTDIDKFSMVEFDAYLNYVTSDGLQAAVTHGGLTTVKAEYGAGTWELVRDAEKASFGYEGLYDQTSFPLASGLTPSVVKAETYDTLIIESDRSYLSPDNQYVKRAPLTTVIYIPYTATSNQMDSVLAVLNPWMASTPAALPSVSF